jgi:adenosylcobinamide-GDP ribazoletransferase
VLIVGFKGLLAVLLAFVAAVLVGLIAWRKFGGQTGDVLGAGIELSETAMLVALAVGLQP